MRTWPQAERWASQNLRHIGYETFLPLVGAMRRDRVVRSMWHKVAVPLFAGYVFLRHSPDSSWGPIRDAPGVRGLVKAGNQLVYTPDEAVEALRGTLRGVEAFSALGERPRRPWLPGMPCSPRTGPFAGQAGVVLQVGTDRVRISLLVFGALREALIAEDQLATREA